MNDNPAPVSSDEVKTSLRPAREVLARLGDDAHAEAARRALDTVRDESLKSVEMTPSLPSTAFSTSVA